MPRLRMSVRASFFGQTLTGRPPVPRGYLLGSNVRRQTVSADDTVVGYSEQTQWRLLWGNLKAYFMIQFPARTAWDFVSRRVLQHLQPPKLRQPDQLPEPSAIRASDADAEQLSRQWWPERRPQPPLEILGSVGLIEISYLRRYLTDLRSALRQL